MPNLARKFHQLAAVAIALATSAVAEEPNGEDRFSIAMAEPLKIVLSTRTALNRACRTPKPILGCTIFAEEKLFCSCERKGDRWILSARASAVPVMYLFRPDIANHEQLHIDDVCELLKLYLNRLTSRHFDTEEQCSRAAQAESNEFVFVARMNAFRRKSNEKLD